MLWLYMVHHVLISDLPAITKSGLCKIPNEPQGTVGRRWFSILYLMLIHTHLQHNPTLKHEAYAE